MIVIADATPLNYLILIRQAELLPRIFTNVLIPPAVLAQLQHVDAPGSVRAWIQSPPSWLTIQPLRAPANSSLDHLDLGEREAIALAEPLHADQLLLDEIEARREAARRNLPFIGTLGVLREAAQRDLISLPSVLAELQETTFFVDPALIRSLLDEDAQRKSPW